MSKFQKDRDIFFGICKFFSSNAWWKPVISFIYSNCRDFNYQYSTEEEHKIYISFLNMVEDLVDNFMCSKLRITPEVFENLMGRFLVRPNDKATVIFDTLKQATDYNEFCRQMYQCNVRIENSITNAILKVSEDESIMSTDELAIRVAELIEKDQVKEIKDLVHKGCVQMKKLMGISELSPSAHKHSHEKVKPSGEKEKDVTDDDNSKISSKSSIGILSSENPSKISSKNSKKLNPVQNMMNRNKPKRKDTSGTTPKKVKFNVVFDSP